jgi:hypothetical protein
MATGRIPTTANSPLTAKGDLFTFSTGSAKLAVGSNGDTLVADSSAATGLNYKPLDAAGKNDIINGGFDIWQRGTANTTTASVYTADRWQKGAATSYGISRQTTSDTTNLPTIQYCARSQRTNASAVTTANELGYSIESVNSTAYAGQAVILSFYARAGANMTNSNALVGAIYSGTGTDQNIMTTGLTGQAIVATSTKTLTTTWQRFTVTGTVGATATQLALYFSYTPTGTAGANDYYEITGVQLELGSTATVFSRAGGTIQGELAACQRYYVRWGDGTQAYSLVSTSGWTTSTTTCAGFINMPVRMRTVPSAVEYANTLMVQDINLSSYNVTAVAMDTATFTGNTIAINFTSSGMTAARFARVLGNNSTSAYLALNAEL